LLAPRFMWRLSPLLLNKMKDQSEKMKVKR